MKRIFSAISAFLAAAVLMTGCAASTSSSTVAQSSQQSDKLQVVTTIFPVYDWVSNIVGEDNDNVELTLLIDDGVDLHSYQATAQDIVTIADCDVFIYVGGESDSWVSDVLANATNPDMVVLNLLDVLGDDAKIEELVEGMQESEHSHDHDDEETEEDHDHDEEECTDTECTDEDHDHDEDEDHDHDEEECTDEDHDHDEEECTDTECTDEDHDHDEEYDEHIWLSLNNAKTVCDAITVALIQIDAQNSDSYTANNAAYSESLAALDAQYEAVVSAAAKDTILFADRFPFRYLVDDYGISYYAAFVGCSAETEASFETIVFLAEKVNELELGVVLVIESSDQTIANTVITSTTDKDQTILVMDSMQSTTAQDIAQGATYLSIMESNLEVLKAALQ